MGIQNYIDHSQDEELLQDLTVPESEAFIELLILTVMADQNISEEELEELTTQWGQLPFAGDEALETLAAEYGNEVRTFLEENMEHPTAMDEFLAGSSAKLEREGLDIAALRMIALVALADGLEDEEEHLFFTIANALGHSRNDAQELLETIITE